MKSLFEKLAIPDIILIKTEPFTDERGFFMETYKHSTFTENGIPEKFVQENFSYSTKNVLRGLHYQQDPHAQGKLVRCLRGEIFDVVVDIRENSPSFGKWVSTTLSEDNKHQLYVPPGFAHGFCVTSDDAVVVYKCTKEYMKDAENGISWNDPTIAITWPIQDPVISEKDQQYKPFTHGK